jgi:hypothetical protein
VVEQVLELDFHALGLASAARQLELDRRGGVERVFRRHGEGALRTETLPPGFDGPHLVIVLLGGSV